MPLVSLSATRSNISVDLLGLLSLEEEMVSKLCSQLKHARSVSESVVLSTCARFEIFAEVDQFHSGIEEIIHLVGETLEIESTILESSLQVSFENEVIRRIFLIASGLDSPILGENEILGQIRKAARLAQDEHSCGKNLSYILDGAISAGRKLRKEVFQTPGTTNYSARIVALAKALLGSAENLSLLIIGTGSMGTSLLEESMRHNFKKVAICGSSDDRSRNLANEFGGNAIKQAEILELLTEFDVLIMVSTNVKLEVPNHKKYQFKFNEKKLLVFDLTMPSQISMRSDIAWVRYFDFDALIPLLNAEGKIDNLTLKIAHDIFERLLSEFLRRLSTDMQSETLRAFRTKIDNLRTRELDKFKKRYAKSQGLTEEQLQLIEEFTISLTNKVIHDPTEVIRLSGNTFKGKNLARALQILFDLE